MYTCTLRIYTCMYIILYITPYTLHVCRQVVNNTSEGTNSVGGGGKPHYSVVELREGGHRVIPSGISPSQSPDIQHKDLHDLHGKVDVIINVLISLNCRGMHVGPHT